VPAYRVYWAGVDPVGELAGVDADAQLPARLTFTTQPGGVLRVTDPVLGHVFDVSPDSWFDENQSWPAAQHDATYQQVPDVGPWEFWITGGELPELAVLTTRVDGLEVDVDTLAVEVTGLGEDQQALEAQVTHQEFGQANVSGLLLANATTDVTVTWTGALPVTTYQVRVVSVASGLLGSLVLDSVVSRTVTQCTVRLRATALLTLSGSVVLSASCVT
jgi:hypothetical protein